MTHVIQPFHLLAIALAGWFNRHQQAVIDFLIFSTSIFSFAIDLPLEYGQNKRPFHQVH
jgi:hypothetical protein